MFGTKYKLKKNTKQLGNCEVCVSHRFVDEYSKLLGYDTVATD
jgi:hypothetical protein